MDQFEANFEDDCYQISDDTSDEENEEYWDVDADEILKDFNEDESQSALTIKSNSTILHMMLIFYYCGLLFMGYLPLLLTI